MGPPDIAENTTPPRAPGLPKLFGSVASVVPAVVRQSPRLVHPSFTSPTKRNSNSKPKVTSKRTHAAIIDSRGTIPTNFPLGPWTSHYQARDMISQHFRPGFSVVLDSYKRATTKSGAKTYLLCHRNKPPAMALGCERIRGGTGANCKWKVCIEDSDEGWVVSKAINLEHTHDLIGSHEAALAHASLRSIPETMDMFGHFLKQAGRSPADILR